jgi:hypothetical protein
MSEYHDYVQLAAEGQVTPTLINQVGVLSTYTNTSGTVIAGNIGSTSITVNAGQGFPVGTAQYTTQSNPGRDLGAGFGLNSITSAEQGLAVVGPVYQSPGGILNKCPGQSGTVATGGGP